MLLGLMRRVRYETASSLILTFTQIYCYSVQFDDSHLTNTVRQARGEGQLWTASSLPVVIWHYFNCRLMHVLVVDRMLQHHYLQDNVEGQLLDCFFMVGLYFVGSTFLRIQFLIYY